MIEVLEFIFQDFWHFLGTAILLAIISSFSVVNIYHAENKKESSKENKTEKKDENKE